MEHPIFVCIFLELTSKAFQNTTIKILFIKYFLNYEAWKSQYIPALALHKMYRPVKTDKIRRWSGR